MENKYLDYERNFGEDTASFYNIKNYLLQDLESYGKSQIFKKKETLFSQGEIAESVFLLKKGRVKSTCINRTGEETLLRMHYSGGIIGLTAIRENSRRDATATVLMESEIIIIPRRKMIGAMEKDGRLGVWVSNIFLHRLCSFHYRFSQFLTCTVEQRLSHLLLTLCCYDSDNSFSLITDFSHEEFSQIVAARRQTVTMLLNRFSEAGYIELRRRQIHVKNHEALRKIAERTKICL